MSPPIKEEKWGFFAISTRKYTFVYYTLKLIEKKISHKTYIQKQMFVAKKQYTGRFETHGIVLNLILTSYPTLPYIYTLVLFCRRAFLQDKTTTYDMTTSLRKGKYLQSTIYETFV
jgi:hypothetical protein